MFELDTKKNLQLERKFFLHKLLFQVYLHFTFLSFVHRVCFIKYI